MSIAQEIDQMYSDYQAKVAARQLGLRKVASEIKDGFIKHVGVSPNAWHYQDGRAGGARVEIGTGQGNNFKAVPWPNLPIANDGAVEFSISYILLGQQGNYTLTFDLRMAATTEGFEIAVDQVIENLPLSAKEVAEKQFGILYGLMVDAIRSRIDPESIVVHPLKP
ncbi:hypothetical protein G7011_01320 [Pseudomonas plecoglossicida]|uniref:hypothetical protein n=1 Tax=Pseudomonas plecoglossicida TaxID=70775 RepID=UPI0015E37726|nr:hypothetical protein [Pseudomonas plecoglossicida]MBA1195751.1 hypothetical protein [Pseudomonas plecoglossicida]